MDLTNENDSQIIHQLNLNVKSLNRQWIEAFMLIFGSVFYAFFYRSDRVLITIYKDGLLLKGQKGTTDLYAKKIHWNNLGKYNFKLNKKKLLFSTVPKYNFTYEIDGNKYRTFDYFIYNKDTDTRISRETYEFLKTKIQTVNYSVGEESRHRIKENFNLLKEKTAPLTKTIKENIKKSFPEAKLKSNKDSFEEIKKLKELFDLGILNKKEYDKKAKELKKKILD